MKKIVTVVLLVVLTACTRTTVQSTATPLIETTVPTQTLVPTVTATAFPTFTPIPWQDQRNPDDWKNWPILPEVNPTMLALYQEGQTYGRNPYGFSKLGDCQSVTEFFLAGFDNTWGLEKMGDYVYLLDTVNWYRGSWARESIGVQGGLNIAGVQNPYTWFGKPVDCYADESRAACEIRINNPSIVLISYEELWDGETGKYELYMDQLIQTVLAQKMVPVVTTTGSNQDANLIIAKLAVKYHLPVWNFWAAIQSLPDHGISEDGFHLTMGGFYNFVDDYNLQRGWPVRNLTALMSLDAVRKQLNGGQ